MGEGGWMGILLILVDSPVVVGVLAAAKELDELLVVCDHNQLEVLLRSPALNDPAVCCGVA